MGGGGWKAMIRFSVLGFRLSGFFMNKDMSGSLY